VDAMLWWSIPIGATVVAIVVVAWRARPPRPQGLREAQEARRRLGRALGAIDSDDPTRGR